MRSRLAQTSGLTVLCIFILAIQVSAQDGAWLEKGPLSTGRAGLQAETVDGVVYAIGGVNGVGGALPTEAFDPIANSWSDVAALPPPPGGGGQRSAFATAVAGGKIYAFGGGDGGGFLDDVQAYDPATGSWTVRAPMPASRAYGVAAAMDGKIYLMGGHVAPGGPDAPALEYDPVADTWSAISPMLTHRINPGVAVLNGKFYVVGGATTGGGTTTVEVYDPAGDAWMAVQSLSVPRMNPSVRAVGGRIYAFGGVSDAFAFLASGEVYDPQLDVWSDAAPLPDARTVAGSAVLDGVLYVIGGQSADFPYYRPEAFAFTPSSPGFMDTDGDLVGDDADNCPAYANADQTDSDADGLGDACDAPTPPNDADGDSVSDDSDNCTFVANTDQLDTDSDGAGDACDGDDDNDAIADEIDQQPLVFSNDYRLDADTFGSVLRNSLWTVSLTVAPGAGWEIRASVSGTGPVDSSVIACDGASRKEMKLGNGEVADWRCDGTTLTLRAVTGSTDFWEGFCASTCHWINTRVPEGDEFSTGSPVTAGGSNGTPLVVSVLDDVLSLQGSFMLEPGESVDVAFVPVAGGEDVLQLEALHGDVPVTVMGQATTLFEGAGPSTFALVLPPPSIDGLIGDVATLALPPNTVRGLLMTLRVVNAAIDRGNAKAARDLLNVFTIHVRTLMRRGLLPEDVGAGVLEDAQTSAAGL